MAKILDCSRSTICKIYEYDNIDIVYNVNRAVLEHNGKGFDIQVLPEITKHVFYETYSPLFSPKKCYRKTIFGDGWGETSLELASQCSWVKWKVAISKKVGTGNNKLPDGITIRKTPLEVLIDERDNRYPIDHRQHMTGIHHYMEGRRVYISVSDEYAAKYFKEVYTNTGLPFCDRILSEHVHILEHLVSDMARVYDNKDGKIWRFEVYTDCVKQEYYAKDDRGWSFCSIWFSNYGMNKLISQGQQYGMALALIETIKAKYPHWIDANYDLDTTHHVPFYGYNNEHNDTTILIAVSLERKLAQQKSILQEW